jgi:hypothetical protein
MKLDKEQKEAAVDLAAALTAASETGLFDEMTVDINPDVINKFCDEANGFIARHTVRQWLLMNYDNTGLMQIQKNDEGALETDDEAILAAFRDAERGCTDARRAIHKHLTDAEMIWQRDDRINKGAK